MKRSVNVYQITIKLVQFLYITLFVYAATSKLIAFDTFKTQLIKSPFLSSYADWMVWSIPLLEYTIAILLLFPKVLLTALYGSLALMTLFTTYIFAVLNFSDSIPCSCGGLISNLSWKEHFIFNILFIAFAILGIILINNQKNNHILNNTA